MPDASEARPKSADWEQTVVAEEAPPEPEPEPAPEHVEVPEIPLHGEAPVEPAEPEPLETLEPAPEPEPLAAEPEAPLELPPEEPMPLGPGEAQVDLPVPADMRAFVRRDGSAVVMKQPYMKPAQRQKLEAALAKGRGVKLFERRWIPQRREPIHLVREQVDALEFKPRYRPKGVQWTRRSTSGTRAAMKGLERVPANLVDKRVVYETEGGFLVEVTYRELGQLRKKYFTVPSAGTRQSVLAEVRGGMYAQATAVSDELIDAVARPRGRPAGRVAAGKVNTWPVRNRFGVEALGLSKRQARALDALGIRSTDQLRVRAPAMVARHAGVSLEEARALQRAAELLLAKGMGPKYAIVLARAGVRGLDGLRAMNPTTLKDVANVLLRERTGKDALPRVGRARAAAWIRAAKQLRKSKQPFPA